MVCQTGLTMRKRPLRHDEEVNLHDKLNRDIGHRVLQLGKSMVKRTVWIMGTASAQRRGRACTTCTTGTSITVIQQLGKIYGPTNSLDHGNMPLRHEGNLHDLYTGTWTTVCTAKVESRWSADHGDEPLRYDREVDDLENGLQLRRNRSFLHPVTRAMSLHTTGV